MSALFSHIREKYNDSVHYITAHICDINFIKNVPCLEGIWDTFYVWSGLKYNDVLLRGDKAIYKVFDV